MSRHHRKAYRETPATAQNTWATFRRLVRYFRNSLGLILLASLANALVTGLTILSMYLMGVAIDKYILRMDLVGLGHLCLGMALLFICTSTLSYADTRIMAVVAQKISKSLHTSIFAQFLRLPLSYFDKQSSGDLMSRLTNDVDNINQTLSTSISSVLEAMINLIGIFIAMMLLSPALTGWSMLILPFVILSTRIVVYFSARYYRSLQKNLGAVNGYAEEHISAQKMLLLYDTQKSIERDFTQLNAQLADAYKKAQAVSVLRPITGFLNNLIFLLVTLIGSYMIIKDGSLTVGILFSFLMYMRRFTRPLNELAALFNTIQSAIAGAERIFTLLDATPEDDTGLKDYDFKGGAISYDHVSFGYAADKEVLHDISFDIAGGETVALVGATGSGKTTIAGLLNRYYDPVQGAIYLDGQDTRSLKRQSLRNHIGLVLQDTFLFTESVADNIRYSRPKATDDEVIAAAKAAGADDFIRQLPHGYETILKDNGSNLSGGQRQLLAVSRAMLADKPLLILDEATSSIDTKTEKIVQASFAELTKGRTTMIIAHRLSTIRNADHIIVIDDGRILEQGNHQTLLEKGGAYARMHASQALPEPVGMPAG
ncbi:MAG: ABC transporter ATP-binding protein [Clostridiales bacterium]|nr:ABC transporter ATP-binding protein [Peptococcus niger]MDU7243969.1 ABC transporter ATP-binding protein [Clostridiales bacterium]